MKELEARESDLWVNAECNKARKALDEARAGPSRRCGQARYFVRQADWLQERFPDAMLRDVEGLVKLRRSRRRRGARLEPDARPLCRCRAGGTDEDFDFEEALRAIHIDLKGLNEEAVELAAQIARNFEELGA